MIIIIEKLAEWDQIQRRCSGVNFNKVIAGKIFDNCRGQKRGSLIDIAFTEEEYAFIQSYLK